MHLREDDGQSGANQLVGWISTEKRACVYEYRVNSQKGYSECVSE